MIFDHFIMTVVCIALDIQLFLPNHAKASGIDFTNPLFYPSILGFALYFCKDSIRGKSIGKHLSKLQVVDNKTDQIASPLRCFLRNLFCILFPLELIATLINPNRRIGDFVTGTKLVNYNPEKTVQIKTNVAQVISTIIISYSLVLFVTWKFNL